MPGIKPGAPCKANALPAYLSLWPCKYCNMNGVRGKESSHKGLPSGYKSLGLCLAPQVPLGKVQCAPPPPPCTYPLTPTDS